MEEVQGSTLIWRRTARFVQRRVLWGLCVDSFCVSLLLWAQHESRRATPLRGEGAKLRVHGIAELPARTREALSCVHLSVCLSLA